MNEWVALLAACALAYLAHAVALTRACLRALRSRASTGEQPTVSVIVCIKDDAEHWPAWWASMKGQQWPAGTEVIAIDDGSTDELPALLTRAAQEEAPFTFAHYRIDESPPGKRDALRFGVGQASGEWLLFTDVDCRPAGPKPFRSGMLRAGSRRGKRNIKRATDLPGKSATRRLSPHLGGSTPRSSWKRHSSARES